MTVIQNVEKAIKKCKGIKLIKVNEHHYIILVKDIDRNTLIKLAENGSIGNARVQKYKDIVLLRGLDCNLNEMPSVQLK